MCRHITQSNQSRWLNQQLSCSGNLKASYSVLCVAYKLRWLRERTRTSVQYMEGIMQSICSPGKRQYTQLGVLLAFEKKKLVHYLHGDHRLKTTQIIKFNLIDPGPCQKLVNALNIAVFNPAERDPGLIQPRANCYLKPVLDQIDEVFQMCLSHELKNITGNLTLNTTDKLNSKFTSVNLHFNQFKKKKQKHKDIKQTLND